MMKKGTSGCTFECSRFISRETSYHASDPSSMCARYINPLPYMPSAGRYDCFASASFLIRSFSHWNLMTLGRVFLIFVLLLISYLLSPSNAEKPSCTKTILGIHISNIRPVVDIFIDEQTTIFLRESELSYKEPYIILNTIAVPQFAWTLWDVHKVVYINREINKTCRIVGCNWICFSQALELQIYSYICSSDFNFKIALGSTIKLIKISQPSDCGFRIACEQLLKLTILSAAWFNGGLL